jgi:hypothetical protein
MGIFHFKENPHGRAENQTWNLMISSQKLWTLDHEAGPISWYIFPPGCGRSVTVFWGWDSHEAQLRCPNEVDGDIYEYEVPRRALNLNYTKLPRPRSPWETSPSMKNPHSKAGNRTREIMISSQKLCPINPDAGPISWYNMLDLVTPPNL